MPPESLTFSAIQNTLTPLYRTIAKLGDTSPPQPDGDTKAYNLMVNYMRGMETMHGKLTGALRQKAGTPAAQQKSEAFNAMIDHAEQTALMSFARKSALWTGLLRDQLKDTPHAKDCDDIIEKLTEIAARKEPGNAPSPDTTLAEIKDAFTPLVTSLPQPSHMPDKPKNLIAAATDLNYFIAGARQIAAEFEHGLLTEMDHRMGANQALAFRPTVVDACQTALRGFAGELATTLGDMRSIDSDAARSPAFQHELDATIARVSELAKGRQTGLPPH